MQRVYIVDDSGCIELRARAMPDLTVRNVSQDVVHALERRAAANSRSVEAEHRELLRETLLGGGKDFVARAAALLQRLRSSIDSTETIRAVGDRVP